jgi:hypothetical protein
MKTFREYLTEQVSFQGFAVTDDTQRGLVRKNRDVIRQYVEFYTDKELKKEIEQWSKRKGAMADAHVTAAQIALQTLQDRDSLQSYKTIHKDPVDHDNDPKFKSRTKQQTKFWK